MSQGSPSKQDRLEKHLARQRGAGVRNLATSFGFSFGFQPSTTEQQHSEEPPAKRRKSAHSCVDKAEVPPLPEPEHDAELTEHRATRRTVAKRKQPRRFEAASDDDRPETVASRNSAHQNDSFVVSKKSAGKRSRPRKDQQATRATAVEEGTAGVQEDHAPSMRKRGRPRKAESITDEVEVAGTIRLEGAVEQPAKPTRKRGRPPKTLVAKEPETVTNRTDPSEPTASSTTLTTISQHQDMDLAAGPVDTPTAEELTKPSVKKRGRPRKAKTEAIAPFTEIEQSSAITKRMEESSKPKTACQAHYQPEHVAAEPTCRPRRQAAATAMSKVSEGFIEEEAPIDKKRRDPDMEPVAKRGRKKFPPSTLPIKASNSHNRCDTALVESVKDCGRDASAESAKAAVASSHQLPSQPQVPVEVKTKSTRRTKSRPVVLADPVSNQGKCSPDSVPQRSERATKRVPLSETHTNIAMPTPSPEKPAKGTQVACQGRQQRAVDVKCRSKTTAVVRDTPDAQSVVEVVDATKPRVVKPVNQTIKKRPERDESLPPKPGCYPEAFGSGSTDMTEHAVPENDMIVAEGRPSGRAKGKSAPIADRGHITDEPRRQREIQKEDRADNHKVDWLFENTTLRRSLVTTKKRRRPVAKRRAAKDDDGDTAEMDLDDLLSNIASFVPKSMRV